MRDRLNAAKPKLVQRLQPLSELMLPPLNFLGTNINLIMSYIILKPHGYAFFTWGRGYLRSQAKFGQKPPKLGVKWTFHSLTVRHRPGATMSLHDWPELTFQFLNQF